MTDDHRLDVDASPDRDAPLAFFTDAAVYADLHGTGSGTVTASGFSCADHLTVCTGAFTAGAGVTFTATAARGSTFTGWSGVCTGMGTTCTVTATDQMLVVAKFSDPTNGAVQYYHIDLLGSVRATSDDGGEAVERHDYLAFGDDTGALPASGADPKRFLGNGSDRESGLDDFGARAYNSKIGRFMGVDPLMAVGANLGRPQRWNRYAYALNNPMRFIDRDGLAPVSDAEPSAWERQAAGLEGGYSEDGRNEDYAAPFSRDVPTSISMSFQIPKVIGAGDVRIELFIMAATAYFLRGDGRDFDDAPNPDRSRVSIDLNFETGQGAVQVNSSCTIAGTCKAPMPFGQGNTLTVTRIGNSVALVGKFTNFIIRTFGPSIDIAMRATATSFGVHGTLTTEGFPSIELTRTAQNGTTRLLRIPETTALCLTGTCGKSTYVY